MATDTKEGATPKQAATSEQKSELKSTSKCNQMIIAALIVAIGIVAAAFIVNVPENPTVDRRPVAWITGPNIHHGYLKHVIDVFQRIGFQVWLNSSEPPFDWHVLWSHEYPFSQRFNLPPLKPFQKVNHFPGSGFITNKVNLATSGLKHIPKAFNVPREKEAFLKHSKEHPEKLWVQKDNNHRGIRVKSLDQLDLDQKGTFIQEYIQNPLLIDGKKFDIGLYVTLTSINPLRVYIFASEVLLRFCAKPYYPFSPLNPDTYVVGDVYTPIWEVPSLKKYYVDLNMNMKASLNAYIRNKLQVDSNQIWQKMEESIKTIYFKKEEQIFQIAGAYPSVRNFFEMVRFDFALDEDLNVYLMEANMSPNLASAKYPENRLIYEKVLFSLFSLVGVTRMPQLLTWQDKPEAEWNMLVQEKDLSILAEVCSDARCSSRENSTICEEEQCDICYPCLTEEFKTILKDICLEEHSRYHNKRLIPSTSVESPITLGHNNYLQDKWFIGKCLVDPQWCN